MADAPVALSVVERAALLKCRYAARYDDLQNKNRKRGTPEEYAEESKASRVTTPTRLFLELAERGFLGRPWGDHRMRLTDAGHAALRVSEGPR